MVYAVFQSVHTPLTVAASFAATADWYAVTAATSAVPVPATVVAQPDTVSVAPRAIVAIASPARNLMLRPL
ncbi:hypothetical protein GCM10023147_18140 [Tsukamurella soli]|uniref:Uncharacterized protein n=1 Tax=Tsukamurella soli TaxID=644556 RepID=A0ABP8JGC5_9ACTN